LGEDGAVQVVGVPAGLDEDDEGGGGEAGDGDVRPPLPHLRAVLRGVGLLAVFVGVVDDEYVEGFTGESAAHPDGDETADVTGDREPGHRRGVAA
jgi:hypothetical protein